MNAILIFFIVYALQATYFILSLKKCLIECRDQHLIAISIAKCCVSLTVPISLFHSYEHLSCFTKPRLQSQIVRIIWMVPVYSVEGMASISHPHAAFYLQAAREWYEGFVIYSFMIYLLNFLTDRYPDLVTLLAEKSAGIGHHKYPFCLLQPWKMGAEFLIKCKFGVFQYVLMRCALTVISIPAHWLGWYVEGEYSLTSLYTWTIAVSCVSQMFALYTLFLFYHALHEEVYILRPFAKFICIKIVVFFSWFQGVAIEALVQLGHISALSDNGTDQSGHTVQEVAGGIQDLLICMEMFLAAIAFYNSFPVSEFSPNELERDSLLRRRKYTAAPIDTAIISPHQPSSSSSLYFATANASSAGLISHPVSPFQPVSNSNIYPSPVARESIIDVIDVDSDESDRLLFPIVKRRLDLGNNTKSTEGRGPRFHPIISFWGSVLQLIGGGESTKRLIASDPYSDEDILGNASDAMPRARQDYHESTAQETTTKRETILTSDSIRTMGLTENFVRFDDKMPQTNSKQGYLKMSTLGPLDDVSAYKFQKSILSPSLHSPVAAPLTLPRSDYRWRTGKDPLHQRSGDGISRGFNVAIISKPLGDLPVLSKLKLQQNESVCSRVLTRISGGFLSLPGCTGWKWTFGRQEIESLIDTCRHYCKSGKSVASKYFCWGKFESISKSSSNSEKFSANYACSTYEIYSTSLFLPSLCTVLFPIEMMQDFSDSWVYMCDFFWNMPLLISRCSSTKRGEQ